VTALLSVQEIQATVDRVAKRQLASQTSYHNTVARAHALRAEAEARIIHAPVGTPGGPSAGGPGALSHRTDTTAQS